MFTRKNPIACRLTVIATLGMLCVAVATPALWAQSKGSKYSVVRLAFPGAAAASTEAQDLNDKGNVAGSYRNSAGVKCGFHYQYAATVPYTSLGGGVTARGLNRHDELVGSDDTLSIGLYWSSPVDTTPTPLLPLVRAYTLASPRNQRRRYHHRFVVHSGTFPRDTELPRDRRLASRRAGQRVRADRPAVSRQRPARFRHRFERTRRRRSHRDCRVHW